MTIELIIEADRYLYDDDAGCIVTHDYCGDCRAKIAKCIAKTNKKAG